MSASPLNRGLPDYIANLQLRHRLGEAVRAYLYGRRDLVVVDVGAGEKPYISMFAPFARRYIALDYRPRAGSTDLAAVSELLPLSNSTVDVILATQMLEHVPDPSATVHEWRRVLHPGGLVFASTHGTSSYHPDPTDYWRWTHAGLRKLFEDCGLNIRSIEGCGGNLSTYTTLLVSDVSTRVALLGLSRPFTKVLTAINVIVERLDPVTRTRPLNDCLPGGLPTNYLVVAERQSE